MTLPRRQPRRGSPGLMVMTSGRCWTRRTDVGALRCWCAGSKAWHPLAPSWVPLPTPEQVKDAGVHELLLVMVVEAGGVAVYGGCGRLPHTFYAKLVWNSFDEPLGSGRHWSRCPLVSLWLLLEEFHTPALRRGNLDIIFTTPRIRLGTPRTQRLA